jgi:hypothetical protein
MMCWISQRASFHQRGVAGSLPLSSIIKVTGTGPTEDGLYSAERQVFTWETWIAPGELLKQTQGFLSQIFACYKWINSEALHLRIYLPPAHQVLNADFLQIFSFIIFICQIDFTPHCQSRAPLSRKHLESVALFILFSSALCTITSKYVYSSFTNYQKITIL